MVRWLHTRSISETAFPFTGIFRKHSLYPRETNSPSTDPCPSRICRLSVKWSSSGLHLVVSACAIYPTVLFGSLRASNYPMQVSPRALRPSAPHPPLASAPSQTQAACCTNRVRRTHSPCPGRLRAGNLTCGCRQSRVASCAILRASASAPTSRRSQPPRPRRAEARILHCQGPGLPSSMSGWPGAEARRSSPLQTPLWPPRWSVWTACVSSRIQVGRPNGGRRIPAGSFRAALCCVACHGCPGTDAPDALLSTPRCSLGVRSVRVACAA